MSFSTDHSFAPLAQSVARKGTPIVLDIGLDTSTQPSCRPLLILPPQRAEAHQQLCQIPSPCPILQPAPALKVLDACVNVDRNMAVELTKKLQPGRPRDSMTPHFPPPPHRPEMFMCVLNQTDGVLNRDQMNVSGKSIEEGADAVAEIVVPDSYSGFVRLLLFLYTGDHRPLCTC